MVREMGDHRVEKKVLLRYIAPLSNCSDRKHASNFVLLYITHNKVAVYI